MSRHWPFGILVTAGVVLRGCAWLAYRPALAYIDTPRYLGHEGGLDPLGYSYLLVRPVLLAGGGLAAVTAIWHLLGLAMTTTVYALLTRRGVNRWLAAIATAPVLLDAYQVVAVTCMSSPGGISSPRWSRSRWRERSERRPQ